MQVQHRSSVKAVGIWDVRAQAPLTVSDPIKLRMIMGLPLAGKAYPKRGIVPVSVIQRLEPTLTPGLRRELARILSGGADLWKDRFQNLVVNQGLNDLLGVTLSGTTQDTTWFVGLMSSTPTAAAADTLASHAGWTERTEYDEVNRVAWVDAGEASQSITNGASPAVFTLNATVTIGGAFLAGVNTGTSGRLYAAGAFTAGNKGPLNDNDTISVTATFTTS